MSETCTTCRQTIAEISDTDLGDIFVTAIEQGIGYWARDFTVHGAQRDGTYYERFVTGHYAFGFDRETGISILVDADELRDGILQAAADYGWSVDQFIQRQDAETCDVAFQYAAFGTVIYG